MTDDKRKQNILNHVVLCLDASWSMASHSPAVVKVADNLIADLAKLSKDMDQETRVTIYTFDDDVQCVIYDKDVLRLPSIASLYKAHGNTALLKATQTAIEDLAMTPEKYGDHSYLLYVITDGEENASNFDFTKNQKIPGTQYLDTLPPLLATLGDNWTVAGLVPNAGGIIRAKKYGFPANNLAIWDTNSVKGMEEVGRTIAAATTTYMQARATGTRGTKNLFQTNVGSIDTAAVTAAGLTPVDPRNYVLAQVDKDCTTSEYVSAYRQRHPDHQIGDVFYQLTGSKPNKGRRGILVHGYKPVAVMENASGRIYTGPEARKLVGLPDHNVSVDPTDTKGDYMLFVRSDAPNRNLFAHTKFLMMKK